MLHYRGKKKKYFKIRNVPECLEMCKQWLLVTFRTKLFEDKCLEMDEICLSILQELGIKSAVGCRNRRKSIKMPEHSLGLNI